MDDPGLDSSFIPALHKPSALLPIAKHRESLLYLIETNPVTIVVGQTGSGKTTQIPRFLEKAGWCADGQVVGVTQVSFYMCFSPSSKIPLLTLHLHSTATPRGRNYGSPQSC